MCNYDVCKYNHGNGGLYLGLRRKVNLIQGISFCQSCAVDPQ